MGNPIGKGEYTTPTGLDTIADTLNTYGQNQVDARYDGHHTVQHIVDGIGNFLSNEVSKSCKLDLSNKILTIGNATITYDGFADVVEGDVYIDAQGNITTS